ncbi:helix-turn-helix transcriptional regulator [Gimesia chilikensis]|uniref:helix-turn-helix transcriptional regulator n=1 Tax=Gimesia chilikensis TaxID=2605989 RepID=UPI003A9415DC
MGKASSKRQSRKTEPPKETGKAAANSAVDSASSRKTGSESGHRWTFLTNHAHVLIVLHRNPTIVLREVALEVGITERAVQRIIQDLEEEGFLQREKIGRQNHYEVLTDQALRHPIEKHKSIGDLLNLVALD